jgi:hypothetical protein
MLALPKRNGAFEQVLLSGLCRGAWIAFWSSLAFRASRPRRSCRPGRARGARWSGRARHSRRTRLPSGTLGTRVTFRTRWTGWSFKAASERQAGYERTCCHDTHKSVPSQRTNLAGESWQKRTPIAGDRGSVPFGQHGYRSATSHPALTIRLIWLILGKRNEGSGPLEPRPPKQECRLASPVFSQ